MPKTISNRVHKTTPPGMAAIGFQGETRTEEENPVFQEHLASQEGQEDFQEDQEEVREDFRGRCSA